MGNTHFLVTLLILIVSALSLFLSIKHRIEEKKRKHLVRIEARFNDIKHYKFGKIKALSVHIYNEGTEILYLESILIYAKKNFAINKNKETNIIAEFYRETIKPGESKNHIFHKKKKTENLQEIDPFIVVITDKLDRVYSRIITVSRKKMKTKIKYKNIHGKKEVTTARTE